MYKSNDFRVLLSLVGVTVSLLLLITTTVLAPIGNTIPGQITKEMIADAEAIYAGTASIICEGKQDVITLTNNTTLKGQWKLAKFDIDHVIKGVSVKQVEVEFFDVTAEGIWMETVPLNKRCLVFLVSKKGAEGTYRLLDFTESSVSLLASDPPTQLPEIATILERLQSELLNAIMAKKPYIARVATLNILGLNLSNKRVTKALKVLSKDKDKDIKIVGTAIATRIRLGDKTAIKEGKTFVESGQPITSREITSAIRGLRGTKYIDELKGVFESKSVLLRRSAILALRSIKDKTTLPILEKALKDTDTEVQFLAINGLLDRTANTDSESYKKWQKWWKANKDKVLEERRKRDKFRKMMEEKDEAKEKDDEE